MLPDSLSQTGPHSQTLTKGKKEAWKSRGAKIGSLTNVAQKNRLRLHIAPEYDVSWLSSCGSVGIDTTCALHWL
jgi:hypothetical protein